jgi:hypothetical protein
VSGEVKGVVAAKGDINFGRITGNDRFARYFENVGAALRPSDAANTAAIDALFTNRGTALDLGGLDLIVQDLAALAVDRNGTLVGPVA